jgi:hypothetical protein
MRKAVYLSKQYREFRERCGVKDPVMLGEIEEAYFEGYNEAEKDLELTWENIRELYIIFAEVDTEIELCKTDITAETLGYYKEVLKRFKSKKEK